MVPASGEPIPVLIIRARPPQAAKKPPSAYEKTRVGPTLTPLRKAAVRSLPTAYRAKPRRPSLSGIQTTATTPTSRRIPFGTHGVIRLPDAISMNASGAPPPGLGRISSATPPQTNDIASVTTMSGTRVRTAITPFKLPARVPPTTTRNATSSAVGKS